MQCNVGDIICYVKYLWDKSKNVSICSQKLFSFNLIGSLPIIYLVLWFHYIVVVVVVVTAAKLVLMVRLCLVKLMELQHVLLKS